MKEYPDLEWTELVALLLSDLDFRSKGAASEARDAIRHGPWEEVFHRLYPNRSWGDEADDAAWGELAQRISPVTKRVFANLGLPLEDADETVQRVLLKLQSRRAIERLALAKSFPGYIAAVARHMGYDVFRKRTAEKEALARLGLEILTSSVEEEATWPSRNPRIANLRKELRFLPDDERKLLRLRFWKGMTIGDIAKQAGVSYAAVASKLFRILKKLREWMKEFDKKQ